LNLLFIKFSYIATPIIAYLLAGSIKFMINSLRRKQFAFSQIGLGGIPSTHTTIITSVTVLVILREGIDSAIASLSLALALIIIIDAMDLRRKVGQHAKILNNNIIQGAEAILLREKIGHTPKEVLAGMVLGVFIGFSIYNIT
jgi:uncharacterized protein